MAKKVTAPAGGLELVPGQIYRRTTLHEHFGGQQQGGISTPSRYPMILLFTGASGVQHGYEDGWSDGVFWTPLKTLCESLSAVPKPLILLKL